MLQGSIAEDGVLQDAPRYRQFSPSRVSVPSYGALVIRRAGDPIWVTLGSATEIDQFIHWYAHAQREPSRESGLTKFCEMRITAFGSRLRRVFPGT